MKAVAWSFHLPKSRLWASHWHLQMTKTSLGVVFLGTLGYYSVFFLRLPWFFGAGKCKLCLQLQFAKVSAQGEPLALTTDENLFWGVFWVFFVIFLRFLLGLQPRLPGAGKWKLRPGASICQSLGSVGAAGAEI